MTTNYILQSFIAGLMYMAAIGVLYFLFVHRHEFKE